MSGTFRGTFNTSSDSDRISEELLDAFNMDDYDEDRESRHRARSVSSRSVQGRKSGSARSVKTPARRNKKKDRQLIAMVGFSILAFLLIVEILCGILIWKMPVLPVLSVLIMNLAIGLILGPCLIVAPILMVAVEIAAGIFAGQWLLAVLGVILLAGAQALCFALK